MADVLKMKSIVDILRAFVDITLAELKYEEKKEIFNLFLLETFYWEGWSAKCLALAERKG